QVFVEHAELGFVLPAPVGSNQAVVGAGTGGSFHMQHDLHPAPLILRIADKGGVLLVGISGFVAAGAVVVSQTAATGTIVPELPDYCGSGTFGGIVIHPQCEQLVVSGRVRGVLEVDRDFQPKTNPD